MAAVALLDSNVIVAILEAGHVHHPASIPLVTRFLTERHAVAAHSCAEVFSTLTRSGQGGAFRRPPAAALAGINSIVAVTDLVGLTPQQTFDAIRGYAANGGIGPRIYDRLIGEVAVRHGIPTIITWNTGHMRDLFPALAVLTPAEMLARSA